MVLWSEALSEMLFFDIVKNKDCTKSKRLPLYKIIPLPFYCTFCTKRQLKGVAVCSFCYLIKKADRGMRNPHTKKY